MNEQQIITDTQWGERCSVKLDKLLSRVDQLIGMLFHLKGTFTVEDAALYLGITTSHLYKLVRKYDILTAVLPTGVSSLIRRNLTNG